MQVVDLISRLGLGFADKEFGWEIERSGKMRGWMKGRRGRGGGGKERRC